MPEFHCVVDTSALLKKYRDEAGTEIMRTLFNREDCAIHVLNVSIPEVTGAFVRWQLDGTLNPVQRDELLKLFIEDIKEYRVIIHNVTHRNIVKTDDIWDNSISVQPPKQPGISRQVKCPKCGQSFSENVNIYNRRIGPVDVLVLSVCSEIQKAYGKAYLFSSDGHMLNIAQKLGMKIHNPETLHRLPF
jgi:hypothetical protein